MNILKILGIILIGIVVIFVVIGFTLPAQVHMERSIEIKAPASAVYKEISGYKNFNAWSPWAKLDPNTKYSFAGPDYGVGAEMSWTSDNSNVGKGKQMIIEVKENTFIKSELHFEDYDKSIVTWNLNQNGENTKVTWGMDSDYKSNIVGRYFGLFVDKMVGADYEKGLSALKTMIEANAVSSGSVNVQPQAH